MMFSIRSTTSLKSIFHANLQFRDFRPKNKMDSHQLYNTHVKLLALDLLSLNQTPEAAAFSRAEAVGTVAWRELKPDKFLKFSVDDGTGCVSCVLWLNHLTSPYFARRSPPDVRLIADAAARSASAVRVGAVARVRGRITKYRGETQITVSDVVAERDPNAEILHWLECVRLARRRYDFLRARR